MWSAKVSSLSRVTPKSRTMTLALAHLKEDRQTEVSLQSVPEAIAIAEEQQKLDSLCVSKTSSFSTGSVLEEFLFLIYRPTGLPCNSRRSSIFPTKISILHD